MDRAGFDADMPLLRVDLDHAIHVGGEIQDDARAQGLAGEAGTAAARGHGNAALMRERDGAGDITRVERRDDGEGFAPEDAGRGGEERERDRIGAHLTLEARP